MNPTRLFRLVRAFVVLVAVLFGFLVFGSFAEHFGWHLFREAGGQVVHASEPLPVVAQNALVKKYCAVCHTDRAKNGGLSLEHFDAATAPPSLAAMLVSKLKNGAMGAAGIPQPDKATVDALMNTLTSEATGADQWSVSRTENAAVTASILRALPSTKHAGEPSMYRLVVACNAATREGEMQLSWAPVPTRGSLSASVDGATPVTYTVEGTEKMGNGSQGTTGPAAMTFRRPLPAHTLTISDLFPNEKVEFPFGSLPQSAHQSLAACFTESHTGH